MSAQKRSTMTAVWDFFCSLKLTVVTLILLAVTSIIGTVIQQNASPQEYLRFYSEDTYHLLEALQFTDMYHSWWYVSLLGLFSINLICCSIKRLPRVMRTVRNPVLVADDTLFKTLSNVDENLVSGNPTDVLAKVESFVSKRFARTVVTEKDGVLHVFAQKGAYSRFGVYVTHLSILFIFLGAIIGSVWGYKGYANIVEGSAVSKAWLRGENQPIDLGFSVRCDDFSVSYYDSGRPKEYRSVLTVIENGKEVISKRPIVVNDPLSYKGITFYQASYGPSGDPVVKYKVQERATGKKLEGAAHIGESVILPGGASFRVADFTPSYQNFGPAARVEVAQAGVGPKAFVVLQNFPEFDARRGGDYIFALAGYEQNYFTGLQVAKDPGVWVVWLGCTLMVLGTLIAFFMSHRRMWVSIQPVNGKIGVKLGGTTNRNQPAFELYFDKFKEDFKAELKS